MEDANLKTGCEVLNMVLNYVGYFCVHFCVKSLGIRLLETH